MRRVQQPDTRAQEVRAVAKPGFADPAHHRPGARDAAPFGDVGLYHAQRPGRDQGLEGGFAGHVLARRQRRAACVAQPLPVGPGPVGAQGLFDPAQVEALQGPDHRVRAGQVPALVGVDHQRFTCGHVLADPLEIAQVALAPEAYLQLEGAIALGALTRHHLLGRIGVDAAGVDRHVVAIAPEHAPQRQTGPPGDQIPQRQVDAGDGLRDRTVLAGLQGQHRGGRLQVLEAGRRRFEARAHRQRTDHRLDQPGAVFGAARREVAPDLAPAVCALGVFEPHQHGRPVVHHAERRAHRRGDRAAQHVHIDPGDGEGGRYACRGHAGRQAAGVDGGSGQGVRSISRWMKSPR